MPDLKPIHVDSIPRAIAKAERYRLLNEPREAESICRDILAIDAGHQDAAVILLLSVTDQFPHGHVRLADAEPLIGRLRDDYAQSYYQGVMLERWAKALLTGGHRQLASEYFHRALEAYEQAQAKAPSANEDATLRWNTCARIMNRHKLEPGEVETELDIELESFEDEVPRR